VRSAVAAGMANILLFATVNHIRPASGKSFESAPAGLGIREKTKSKPTTATRDTWLATAV
jgi:hypothetical protein